MGAMIWLNQEQNHNYQRNKIFKNTHPFTEQVMINIYISTSFYMNNV